MLSAAVAHYLFNRYPDVDEGRLSQLKSMLVSRVFFAASKTVTESPRSSNAETKCDPMKP